MARMTRVQPIKTEHNEVLAALYHSALNGILSLQRLDRSGVVLAGLHAGPIVTALTRSNQNQPAPSSQPSPILDDMGKARTLKGKNNNKE